MLNLTLLKNKLSFLCAGIGVPLSKWCAFQARRRSERDLSLLDDRLLNDVGLCRFDDEIVPMDKAASIARSKALEAQMARRRLSCAYFIHHRRHE